MFEQAVDPPHPVVRVFLSSTLADTGAERNYMLEWAFPEIRTWCRERVRAY